MAPFVGPTRNDVLAKLRGKHPHKHLPITLGHGQPVAVIDRHDAPEDARWLLCTLAVDDERAQAEGERRLAAGEPWMPEMRWQFAEPADVVLQATTAAGLAEAIESADDLPYFGAVR